MLQTCFECIFGVTDNSPSDPGLAMATTQKVYRLPQSLSRGDLFKIEGELLEKVSHIFFNSTTDDDATVIQINLNNNNNGVDISQHFNNKKFSLSFWIDRSNVAIYEGTSFLAGIELDENTENNITAFTFISDGVVVKMKNMTYTFADAANSPSQT